SSPAASSPPACADAAADPAAPGSAPRSAEIASPATTATAAPHLFGRSSACALPGLGSSPRLPATARALAGPADARTTTCSRKLPSPLKPALAAGYRTGPL